MKLLFLCFSIFTCSVFAQFENHEWRYGNTSRGISFDQGTNAPFITNDSYTPYFAGTGSTVVNPTNGDLLFYSDGCRVVDASHAVMPNGSGLLGPWATATSGYSCKVPGNCNQWYVFSITTQTEATPMVSGHLYYSIVDMSLPGNGTVAVPLGDVVVGQKNILITTTISEAIEIVPKTNTHDYYLLIGRNNSTVDVYEVNSSGFNFLYNQPLGITCTDMQRIRYCEVNNKVVITSVVENQALVCFDFNPASGICSSIFAVPGTPIGSSSFNWGGILDAEFSPDGTKLYFSKIRGITPSTGGKLYQYDFNFPANPAVLIHNVSTNSNVQAKGLKLGPDGRIYLMDLEATSMMEYLSVIASPNLPGVACNFLLNNFSLGANVANVINLFPPHFRSANSLPFIDDTIHTYCQFPAVIPLNPLIGFSDSESDNLSFSVNSIIGATSGIVGTTLNITPDVGVSFIEVELIYQDDFCFPLTDTMTIQLTITPGTGTLAMPDSLFACTGSSVQLDAGSGFLTYLWSTSEITQTLDVVSSGMYSVETTDGLCIYQDSTFVQFNVPTPVYLGPDQNLCADSLMLTTGIFNGAITWSDGFVGEDNWVLLSSEYSVIAEDLNGCFSYDTVDVVINPIPVIDLGPDISACSYDVIYLEALGYTSVLWSDASTNDSLLVVSTGNYDVTVTDINGCENSDTILVSVSAPTPVNLGPDQNLCADSLMITTGVFNGTITWSDGFVGEDNWVLLSSEYSVIAEDVSGCFSYDTVDVVINPIPQINLGPDLNLCSYDVVYLEAIGFTSVLWNDGSANDSLFVNQNGNYNVIVTNAFGCNSSDNINLNFSIPEQVNLGPDVVVCNTSYAISLFGFSGSVFWSNGSNGTINVVSVSGLNSVIGTDLNGCFSYDTIDVFLAPIPTINLGSDTIVCPNGVVLDASGFSTVIWSDGSTNSTLEILSPGIYSVEVANSFGCIAGDLVEIDFHNPSAISLGPDYETCNNNEVTILTGVEEGDFLWSNGSTQSQITVTETGEYTIQQTLCGTTIHDTIFIEISTLDQVVYIPNAFTPDGDVTNNEFKVFFGDYSHVLNYSLSIYDRWGGLVYSSTDPYATWNGSYTQGLVQDGIYVYLVKIETDCEENQYWVKTGHITVLK